MGGGEVNRKGDRESIMVELLAVVEAKNIIIPDIDIICKSWGTW